MYELKVSGMTCASCADTIGDTLQAIDSKAEVEVNIQKQTILVKSTKDRGTITALIEESGYPVLASREIA